MADTASGEPDWYAHFLRSFGHAFTGAGIWMAVIFAALSLLIGLGPLVSRRGSVFIGLGIGLALLYWITGQGIGELLTGMGTDPSNGPLIALIGLALLPTVPEPVDAPVPAARLFALHPMAATAAIVALAVVPTAVAVIPAAAPATSASAASANTGSTSVEHRVDATPDRARPRACPACRCRAATARRAVAVGVELAEGIGVEDDQVEDGQLDEHVRHGRARHHRPELEVHRAAPTGRRGAGC